MINMLIIMVIDILILVLNVLWKSKNHYAQFGAEYFDFGNVYAPHTDYSDDYAQEI